MKGLIKDMGLTLSGELNITLTVPRVHQAEVAKLVDAPVAVELKKYRERRSLSANALCWVLCQDISKALGGKTTHVDVYRKAIRDVGEYEPLPIKECAVDTFAARWASKGTGWFVDVLDDSKLKGYKLVKAYYGSSTYTTKEMSRLLDYLVDDAQQMGLTLRASKTEIEAAKERWGLDA